MAKVSEIVKTALIRKAHQEGVISGIKLFSNYLVETMIIEDCEKITKMGELLIISFLEQARKLQELKQPQYIFAEHRRAYIDHLESRNWKQQDYIYLRDALQLGGTISPVVHYVGSYTNNPNYDAVRKMERARTFKNKGE